MNERSQDQILPDNILRHMNKTDRKRLGKAGLTASEAIALKEAADEAELQRWCSQLLTQRGIAHIVPPMRKRSQLPPGWPDFTFSYAGQSCAWECKTATGKLSVDQEACIAAMRTEPNQWRVAIIRNIRDAKTFLDTMTGTVLRALHPLLDSRRVSCAWELEEDGSMHTECGEFYHDKHSRDKYCQGCGGVTWMEE